MVGKDKDKPKRETLKRKKPDIKNKVSPEEGPFRPTETVPTVPSEVLLLPSPPPLPNEPVQSVQPVVSSMNAPTEKSILVDDSFKDIKELPIEKIVEKPVALDVWVVDGVAVTGLAHWRKNLPCQDAVCFRMSTRPILVLSDGAGSAAISERGSNAMVQGVSRFLISMEDLLVLWLDAPADISANQESEKWVNRIVRHSKGLLKDLADSERRDIKDVRGTLLLAIVGTHQTFWLQIGDGSIVVREQSILRTLGNMEQNKGEFANQTTFVDAVQPHQVQSGLLPTASINGIALMSDGGAEKLVSNDGKKVAERLSTWFNTLAKGILKNSDLVVAYHEQTMWERTTLDDRSIICAARTIKTL